MIKIGVLVSGNGGTLKFIHQVSLLLDIPVFIEFVVGDRECGATEYSKKNSIPTYIVKYSKNNPHELQEILKSNNNVDYIITNIHKIIDLDTLNLLNGKFINLHYSILPAYSGLIGMETVKKAKLNNASFIGATCHEVTEILDGGRIIVQSCFPVNWEDNENIIIEKVFRSAGLCLLNGLLIKSGYISSFNTESLECIKYNPPLKFNTNLINENFWNILKES